MRICFDCTIDDIITFNRFHLTHSKTHRRVRLWSRVIALLIVAGPFSLIAEASGEFGDPGMGMLVGLTVSVVSAAIVFCLPVKFPLLNSYVRNLYREGANKGTIGPQELELSGGKLIARSPFSESQLRLEVIERIAYTEGYTFIYISSIQAFVIPHDAVTNGDVMAFVDELLRMAPNLADHGLSSDHTK